MLYEVITKSALELAKLIESEKVNIFLCTPSRMQMLLNDERCHSCISNLEEIMLGGEVLNSSLLVKLSEVTTARVINCYGPTEATVITSYSIHYTKLYELSGWYLPL